MGVRLPEELIRRVRTHAALQGRSSQDLVREVLDHAIPPLPRPPEHAGGEPTSQRAKKGAGKARLPKSLKRYFWDVDFSHISWARHRDYIIERLLSVGDHEAIGWVRRTAGDEYLRDWIIRSRARSLRPEQVTFWGLILGLPPTVVQDLLDTDRRWTGPLP